MKTKDSLQARLEPASDDGKAAQVAQRGALPWFACASLLLLSQAPQAYAVRPYLPAPAFKVGASKVESYKNANAFQFDQQVMDHGINVGQIRFDYNPWGGHNKASSGAFRGGGALSGGFFLGEGPGADSKASLPLGVRLVWAQLVTSTLSGANPWGAANNTAFPDTIDKLDPAYDLPNGSGKTRMANGDILSQPSVGYDDFPSRLPSDGNQNWQAQLALVAENPANHTASVIACFSWGFGVTAATDGTLANISASNPRLVAAPPQSFLDSEASYFNGKGGSTLWTFNTHPAFVPEPGALSLLVIGISAILIRHRSRTKE
jgi:hypothetical protein